MNEYQQEIVSYFGYWPAFCDAHILSYEEIDGRLTIEIEYIDTEKSLRAKIELIFYGVSESELSEFEKGSVIDTMRILSGNVHRVEIEPCYGIGGNFKCTNIQAKIQNA